MSGITATRAYNPGDLIYTEKAFAWAQRQGLMVKNCGFCFKSLENEEDSRGSFPCCLVRSKNYITCSKCSIIKYCGLECQEQDLSDHQLECGFLFNTDEDNIPLAFVRLLAKTILKIKGKDWKTITTDMMGNEVSFEDIGTVYETFKENRMAWLYFKQVQTQLKQFIGEENVPEEEELLKIVGKVRWSTFGDIGPVPEIFCLGLRKFDRECIPNANVELCHTVMKIWAIKKIEPSDRITISKSRLLSTDITEDMFEKCQCSDCSAPYGESVLTKLLDRKKAYEAIITTEHVMHMANALSDFELEEVLVVLIDRVLQDQEGVLAESNILHLKTLYLKGRIVTADFNEKAKCFEDLERKMCAVFGEYYSELGNVYYGLVQMHRMLGNNEKVHRYLQKLKNVEMHRGNAAFFTKSLCDEK